MWVGIEQPHMSDSSESPNREGVRGNQTDELRAVGFRLREIQRLLAVRVEQENRRLEAEGIDPVDESRFLKNE